MVLLAPYRVRSLTADNVDDGENNYPHDVDKVPIPGNHFYPLTVRPFDRSRQTEHENKSEQGQTYDDVARVQPYQRVKRCSEKIGAYCQVVVDDQPLPFQRGRHQENRGQQDRKPPPESEPPGAAAAKCTRSYDNCQN